MTYGEVQATTVCPVLILDSRFWGKHISGGKFDAFLIFFVFWVFFWRGGGIWDSGGGSQQINNIPIFCVPIVKMCGGG